MNKEEWKVQQKKCCESLKSFKCKNWKALKLIDAARKGLAWLEAHYAEMLAEHERLRELAHDCMPEGHVRCQAVHHGQLICDEIAERSDLPKGWVVSLVADLCFCPKHSRHVDEVNRLTLHAQAR